MNKLVIFCTSYPEIENTLFLVEKELNRKHISVVIPGDSDLHCFLSMINETRFQNHLNLIHFPDYSKKSAESNIITRFFSLLQKAIGERRYLKDIYSKYFTELRGADVYFFTRVMNPISFYFLNKLKNRNNLRYMHYAPYVDKLEKYSPENVSEWVALVLLKFTYSASIVMGKLPHVKGFPYVPDTFMENEVDEVITQEKRNMILKGYEFNHIRNVNEYKFSIIYFDQPFVNKDRIPDTNTFREELNEIFRVIAKHFKDEEIAIKFHPKYEGDRILVSVGQVLPKFLPAEFFYSDNVKVYMSFFSYAIANVKKGKVISLANLVTFKTDEIRESLKETLIRRSRSNILFPESLDELDMILTNIKKES